MMVMSFFCRFHPTCSIIFCYLYRQLKLEFFFGIILKMCTLNSLCSSPAPHFVAQGSSKLWYDFPPKKFSLDLDSKFVFEMQIISTSLLLNITSWIRSDVCRWGHLMSRNDYLKKCSGQTLRKHVNKAKILARKKHYDITRRSNILLRWTTDICYFMNYKQNKKENSYVNFA